METLIADTRLVAACGLYCGACNKYLRGKCPGCKDNIKANWCTTRTCVLEKNIQSCAQCPEYADANDCKKFNNAIARMFGFVFNSNRKACIDMIQKDGYDNFVNFMAQNRQMSIKRRK